ncbi:MAG: family 16 glycosylhydrolase [Planctomycetaceae bacterium]
MSSHVPVPTARQMFVVMTAAVTALAAARVQAAAADYPYVSWREEFDGTAVEPARWAFDLGTGSQYGLTGWGNNELQYYTDRTQNASVSGGMLRITARSESFGGQAYTSARLKTEGRFSQTGGRFEIRAALPTGQGVWPAIWMLPETNGYGGWAASGEIDIMEARGQQPDRVVQTIHYGGAWPANTQSGSTRILPAGQTIAGFHTYALEWDAAGSPAIRWYVDDVLTLTRTAWWSSGGSYPAPFDKPFGMLLNVAVGGNFVGNPSGTAAFPATMQVDYVRAYTATPPAITLAVATGTLTQAAVGNPLITTAASVTKTGSGSMQLIAANTYAGPTTVQAGRLELAHAAAAAQSSMRVSPGAALVVPGGIDTSVGGLAIDSGGRVDVGTGRLTVAAGWTPATAYASVAAARGDGSWTRSAGVGSSAVAAAVAAAAPRAVGWLDNGDGSITFGFTAPGDATLDGVIDILDAAAIIAAGRLDSATFATWAQGDFNVDGVCDVLDIAEFASTGLFDAGPIGPARLDAAPEAALVTGDVAVSVPEPGPAAAVLPLAAGLAWLRLRKPGRRDCVGRTTDRLPARRTR